MDGRLIKIFQKRFSAIVDAVTSFFKMKNLGASFLICSFLMISLGLSVGLNPHMKVYVMASDETTSKITEIIAQASPEIEVLTPEQEFNELPTLARLGVIEEILIADFPSHPTYNYAHEGAMLVFNAAVLEEYADSDLAHEISSGFPHKVKIVSMSELKDHMATLLKQYARYRSSRSLFGWDVNYQTYIWVVRGIAGLSLLLVFWQAGLMASVATKSGKIEDLYEVVLFTGITFIYSQAVYMVCGSIIGMPLALHGTAPGVAAISLIGPFNSGSYPRAAFAMLGFFLGAYSATKNTASRLSKGEVALFVVAMPLIVILGQRLEPLAISLRPIQQYFQAEWFPAISAYYGSRGIIVYVAGAIAAFMLARTLKVSKLLVFVGSALFVSYGCMRVGDQLPYMAYASIITGILLGLGLIAFFMAVNLFERTIKDFWIRQRTSRKPSNLI